MITGTNELAKQNKITQDMLKVCLQACSVLVQGWTTLFLGCQVSGEVLILQRRCIHDLMQKYAAKFQPFQLYKQIIVGNMHPIYLFMLMYANQRCKFLTSFWKKICRVSHQSRTTFKFGKKKCVLEIVVLLGSERNWPYVIVRRNSCSLAKWHYFIITQTDMTDGKKIGEQESVITTLLIGSHYPGKDLFASLWARVCVCVCVWSVCKNTDLNNSCMAGSRGTVKKHRERQKTEDVRGQLKGQKKIRLSLKQKAGLTISPHYICVLCVRDGKENTFWACAMALLICYIHLHLQRATNTISVLIKTFICNASPSINDSKVCIYVKIFKGIVHPKMRICW